MTGQDSRTGGVLFFNMDLMLNKHSIFITFPLILLRHTNFVFESPESISDIRNKSYAGMLGKANILLAEIGEIWSSLNLSRLSQNPILVRSLGLVGFDYPNDRTQQFGGRVTW